MPDSPRVLVTGGAGFIGSHLCARLLRDGCRVICIDNLFTGHRSNIQPLLDHPRFEYVHHDVVEPIDLSVDRIYHLACPASPPHYQHDPIYTVRINVVGTMNALNLARQCDVPILHASTSEVYGDPAVSPQPESYLGNVNPIGPRACYDEGKRCAETLCFDYLRTLNVNVRVIRIFNTYGPNMHPHDGRVVSNFILQALQGKPLTIYGKGSQTRSFCYIDDLIEGMVRMMHGPAEFHGPVNLGNPHEVTIRELAERIIELTGSRSELVERPLPADDPTRRKPDISLARKMLEWEPNIPLADGLLRTVKYFQSIDPSRYERPTPGVVK